MMISDTNHPHCLINKRYYIEYPKKLHGYQAEFMEMSDASSKFVIRVNKIAQKQLDALKHGSTYEQWVFKGKVILAVGSLSLGFILGGITGIALSASAATTAIFMTRGGNKPRYTEYDYGELQRNFIDCLKKEESTYTAHQKEKIRALKDSINFNRELRTSTAQEILSRLQLIERQIYRLEPTQKQFLEKMLELCF